MPPSWDQDINNTSSAAPLPNKLTQKPPSGAVHISTKSGRKNGTAKDGGGGGGVLAAVTKNASKMSTKPSAPPPQPQSPEVQPVTSRSNGSPGSSPLLDELSSATGKPSTSQNTSEWAKNVPAFFSSPSNLIGLGDQPPPVLPSSYDERLANFGWTASEQRGISNGNPPLGSPPTTRRRPLSYQLDSNFTYGTDDHPSKMSSYAVRRSSLYSHQPQNPRFSSQPPLPHQAQAHFFGAPDANLFLAPQETGLNPRESGYYCGFDSLSTASQDSLQVADNVVVTAYEGGLDVYAVTRRGLNKVASLDGLRGGVLNAKILPWTVPGEHRLHFPLIAVVVHGPVWMTNDESNTEFPIPPTESGSLSHTDNIRGSPKLLGKPGHQNDTNLIEHYQTTVEVYSLCTKKHVSTLLSAPKTRLTIPTTSPLFKAPLPVGSFTLHAHGANVVVASSTTGETWIFSQEIDSNSSVRFNCIGKVWTAVQHGLPVDSPGSNGALDNDWHSADPSTIRRQYKTSILSLNGRWLAYCPPAPSSQISLRATVPGPATARFPGFNAFAPPQLPTVNCMVETPGGESMIKQLAQAATQEMMKGAAYIGKQSVQYWNNYWNKAPPSQSVNGGIAYAPHQNIAQQFPPTHGMANQALAASKEPGLISILDLESLAQQNSLALASTHPLATFKVPHGCSFLSFAPSGLALFTASSKGDVQFVWDLMRIQYAKSSFLKGGTQGVGVQGPHVRQIAQFSRMTVARIVDVVWTSPHGERAAMVTEPGTVHILDLPASAFTWPPPRRKTPFPNSDEGSSESASSTLSAATVASSAVSSLWTAARPLVSRQRRSSAGISAISAASITTQAGHGTQALAAGISRSVGAATGKMNEMRKSGGTKLHLPGGATAPNRACVKLLNGKRSDSVIVVGGGVVRYYNVKSRRADRPTNKQKVSRGAKYVEFRLPSLPDFEIAPTVTRDLDQEDQLDLVQIYSQDLGWKIKIPSGRAPHSPGTESSIPQAEIESNAPYQPFHTDRRVALHVYSNEDSPILSPSVSALLFPLHLESAEPSPLVSKSRVPWAFGGVVKTFKLDVGGDHYTEEDHDSTSDHRALPSSAIERVLRVADKREDVEQIVVTTRRRKGASRSGADNVGDAEEGFFEDDCEVLDFASQRV